MWKIALFSTVSAGYTSETNTPGNMRGEKNHRDSTTWLSGRNQEKDGLNIKKEPERKQDFTRFCKTTRRTLPHDDHG
jgi:hypothetical protein